MPLFPKLLLVAVREQFPTNGTDKDVVHLLSHCKVAKQFIFLTSVWPEHDPAALAMASNLLLENGGAKHPIGPYYTPAAAWASPCGASRLLGRVGQWIRPDYSLVAFGVFMMPVAGSMQGTPPHILKHNVIGKKYGVLSMKNCGTAHVSRVSI